MVLNIAPPAASCLPSLNYNYGKVRDGKATIIACHNLPSLSREGIYDTFLSYEYSSHLVCEVGFHMSVNPSEEDTCSEEEIITAIHKIMYRAGYKDQPYMVFRHNDIDREHYHVVSVRINRNGYKINNYNEGRSIVDYARKIGPEYGFRVNTPKGKVIKEELPWNHIEPSITHRFHPGEPVIKQLRGIYQYALRYSYKDFSDLSAALRLQGVEASLRESKDGELYVSLKGLDAKGNPVTAPVSEKRAGRKWYSNYMEMKEYHHMTRDLNTQYSVSYLVNEIFLRCHSAKGLIRSLNSHGIVPLVCDDCPALPPSIKFVDTRHRIVLDLFQLSDLDLMNKMSLSLLEAKNSIGNKRKLRLGPVLKLLYPVGQPHGNSWSGKAPKTQEQLREEQDGQKMGRIDADFIDRRFVEVIH